MFHTWRCASWSHNIPTTNIVHLYVCLYVRACVRAYVCACIRECYHMRVLVCVCTFLCVWTCAHACVRAYVRARAYLCVRLSNCYLHPPFETSNDTPLWFPKNIQLHPSPSQAPKTSKCTTPPPRPRAEHISLSEGYVRTPCLRTSMCVSAHKCVLKTGDNVVSPQFIHGGETSYAVSVRNSHTIHLCCHESNCHNLCFTTQLNLIIILLLLLWQH